MNSSMVMSHSATLSGLAASTLYHYRVKSSDAAGNMAVSGDFTFTTSATPDTTAPTISSVATSNLTPSGASVAWATNEGSDTQIEYGTSTAYGASTTLDPTLVTSHSATLSGLSASTLYHYRVKSRDAAGNLAVSGDFTLTTADNPTSTGGSITQTNVSDFQQGTDSNIVVTNTSGGELQLQPTFTDDFGGTALGTQWRLNTWDSIGGGPGSLRVSNGNLSLSGAQIRSRSTFSAVPIEARLAFGAAPYEHFGLATNMKTTSYNSWAVFSTFNTTNTLFARVNNQGSTRDVSLGALPTGFHVYRIDPVSGGFSFRVDGVLKATISKTINSGTGLRATLSSWQGLPQPALQADWIDIPGNVLKGAFTSGVLSGANVSQWTSATWNADLPQGTSILVETSSGATATPDTTWSAWSAVNPDGMITSPANPYIRYRITLTTADPSATPTVFDITLNYV